MTALVAAVFVTVYAGLALGRVPGVGIDRTGFALLGALVLYAAGAVDDGGLAAAVDFPTLVVLFGLMVLSAQFYVSGFYDLCAHAIGHGGASPRRLLALTVGCGVDDWGSTTTPTTTRDPRLDGRSGG